MPAEQVEKSAKTQNSSKPSGNPKTVKKSKLAARTAKSNKSTSKTAAKAKKSRGRTEVATFASGCFWSTEAVFERVKGVKSVVSGFSGGNVAYPSYELVCTGRTGHAESVQIEFDPDIVSYERLLTIFWAEHDPTTWNAQGDDFGTQYRSVIFYHNDEQKEAAIASYKALVKKKVYQSPIVTQLVKYTQFYPAEAYHQDYFFNHESEGYAQAYIIPKLMKVEKLLWK